MAAPANGRPDDWLPRRLATLARLCHIRQNRNPRRSLHSVSVSGSLLPPLFRRCTRHSGDVPVIPAPAGIHFRTVIPAMYPSFRRKPESIFCRHSGNVPVIPAKAGIHFLPSFRRCTRHSGASRNPFSYRHSGDVPVIPAQAGIHFLPSFRRKPESSAAPVLHTLRRSNGFAPQPPEKSAIFSDATHLRSAHKCGTLAPASPATRPQGSDVPPKANPRRPSTRRPQPTGRRLKSKGKGIGRKIGQPQKPGSGQHGQTVGIATIVGSGTHSALFHGGVSGHAAGVPTALCRSSNGPGHGKLGHEILQAK